jgi:hypothetical protein
MCDLCLMGAGSLGRRAYPSVKRKRMQLLNIDFWHPTIIFNFMDFRMEFNREAKTTYTRFPDNHWTGGPIVDGDLFHAPLLGIKPEIHRLQHELAHNLIGIEYYGESCSLILYHAAHADEVPLPENHAEEEWLATALQYSSRGRFGPPERNDAGAIKVLQEKGLDVEKLGHQLQLMLNIAELL